jgi:hypothetical protein
MERMLGRVVRASDWPKPRHLRFDKAVSGIEAGTVVFDDDEIVYGYPKIRRAMMLSPAIKRHFSDGVLVEEKMNGHNVRVASVGGKMIALTRGGFICPYSKKIRTWSSAARWWVPKTPTFQRRSTRQSRWTSTSSTSLEKVKEMWRALQKLTPSPRSTE